MNEEERMRYFLEIFHPSLLRLGPGTEAATLRALETVKAAGGVFRPAPDNGRPRVLDLGCGTGAQSLVLARHLDGRILAIDNHQPFLDAIDRRAEAAGVADKIVTSLQDMRTAEYEDGAFDLIWSEGALYSMGFVEGLARTRQWLAADGFLAVSELCWFTLDPPAECRSFLEGQYPVMTDIDSNLSAIRASGYTVLDHFILPESAWMEEFYMPLESRVGLLRDRHAADPDRLEVIESVQKEIDIYRKYGEYYGYLFCVLRR